MTFTCKYTDAQMAAILEEYALGGDRKGLCSRYGISSRTLFRWQAKSGRNRPALAKIVASLLEENERLRGLLTVN